MTLSPNQKDIQTTVSFLTTRVRIPYDDDWGKLKRVLRYVRRKINLPIILRAESLTVIQWWVDATYKANPYMRSHKGVTMSLERVPVTGIANNYRINAKNLMGE